MAEATPPFRARLTVELALWAFPALAFSAVYLLRYSAPAGAVLHHLGLISLAFGVSVSLRVLVLQWFGARWAALLGALASGMAVGTLVGYYLLVVVGYSSWGYHVSWALVATYTRQLGALADALGAGFYLAGAVVACGFALLVLAFYRLFRGGGWLVPASAHVSAPLVTAFALSVLGSQGVYIWQFNTFPDADSREPFSLTFNPASFDRKFQSHFRSASKELEAADAAARAAYRPALAPAKTNVFLIVVDALRAQNLPMNGYARNTTPGLLSRTQQHSLKNVPTVFSACAESACGLMAIASSRYIHQFIAKPFTLQDVLRQHGYGIHMVLGGDHTNFYGLREAYGQVDSYFDSAMSPAFYVNDDRSVVQALSGFPAFSGQPTFIQFHLMSTHALSARDQRSAPFQPAKNYYTQFAGPLKPSAADLEQYANFYDNGIHQTDQTIESLLDTLRRKNYLDDALVVITADHGEFIGERGLVGHAKGVYNEVLHIPLMLLRFGKPWPERATLPGFASQVDIAPTVLDLLNLPVPSHWSGVPLTKSGPADTARRAYFQQNAAFGLVEHRPEGALWKYWVDATSGSEFAFELTQDPREMANRASELPASVRAAWRSRLIPLEISARESLAARGH